MSTATTYLGRDAASGLIRARTEEKIRCCAAAGPAAIRARLGELDQEWDIDRILAAAASGTVLGGLLLGTAVSRRWHLLPLVAGGFLLQHALRGSCPPMNLLRQMGVRHKLEIEEERRELHRRLQQPASSPPMSSAAPAVDEIPAAHPKGRPTVNDYVETASGRIKPASQS